MTMFANRTEVETYLERFTEPNPYWDEPEMPNRAKAARALKALADWTDQNTDGWPYCSKAHRAAAKLVEILEGGMRQHLGQPLNEDISDAELKKAFTPVKSFLTRQGTSWDVVIAPNLKA